MVANSSAAFRLTPFFLSRSSILISLRVLAVPRYIKNEIVSTNVLPDPCGGSFPISLSCVRVVFFSIYNRTSIMYILHMCKFICMYSWVFVLFNSLHNIYKTGEENIGAYRFVSVFFP